MKKRKIFITMMAVMMMMFMAVPAAAAPRGVKGISIKGGSKTIRKGQTVELDSKLSPSYLDLPDRFYKWSTNKPSVVKLIGNRNDEDIKIRGKKKGAAKVTVKIKGTNIKKTIKITVKKKAKETSSSKVAQVKNKLDGYRKDANKILSDIQAAPVHRGNHTKWFKFKERVDALEWKLEDIENEWEYKGETGKISWSTWRSIERKIEDVEDILDRVEDQMEYKFGDFD